MKTSAMNPASNEAELKAYAAHLFLYNLAQTATHAYGVTYVYLMYESVGWTIAWTLSQAFMLTVFRFGGRILLIPLLRKYGASKTAIIGLTCLGVAALGLSLAENTTWLIPLACLSAFGSATYIAVLQSGVFSVIGKRQRAGRSFAIISAINGAAVVANSVAGTLCAYFWQPQWLYVLPVIGFLAAGVSLLFINLPAAVPQGCYSWRTVSRCVPPGAPYGEDFDEDQPFVRGEYYQIWQTVSDGPYSPAFETAEELARWCADNPWGMEENNPVPYEAWLQFINGRGLAPTGINRVTDSAVEFSSGVLG